jgi:hypothetical protein
VGQAIRLDLYRRKSAPEKGRAKKRLGFVKFRLVAPQELSDLRGDAGNMVFIDETWAKTNMGPLRGLRAASACRDRFPTDTGRP